VVEERAHHPIFICTAQVDIETTFLCNSAGLVSQDSAFLTGHSEGFAQCAPFVVDVASGANFNIERSHIPPVRFYRPFEPLILPEFLEMPVIHVLFPGRG